MNVGSLLRLVVRDVRRSGGALSTAAFGVFAGTAALVFFLSLGLGVRKVVLGEVFPLDRVELEPRIGPEPGLLDLLLRPSAPPRGIAPPSIERIRTTPGVMQVYPKLRFAFPAGAFGGKEIIGQDIGAHEILADGVDPVLVAGDVVQAWNDRPVDHRSLPVLISNAPAGKPVKLSVWRDHAAIELNLVPEPMPE